MDTKDFRHFFNVKGINYSVVALGCGINYNTFKAKMADARTESNFKPHEIEKMKEWMLELKCEIEEFLGLNAESVMIPLNEEIEYNRKSLIPKEVSKPIPSFVYKGDSQKFGGDSNE